MDDRGADFHKVDATRTLIRSLSTKIRMAIQVVDKISMTINKIRDEELWPQLKELIQGYVMLKSYRSCYLFSVQNVTLFMMVGYMLCVGGKTIPYL